MQKRSSTFKYIKSLSPDILILTFFLSISVISLRFMTDEPRHRSIHIENFRYGKEPSAIYCNRGDTLHLTFSSRDTGHSFFLEEFDMDVKVSPGTNTVLVFKTSDPTAPPEVKEEVVLVAEHTGPLGWLVSKSNYRCHVWCGPMHAFEHGKLIINPNWLMHTGLGLLLGIFFIMHRRFREAARAGFTQNTIPTNTGMDLLTKFPLLAKLFSKNWFQPVLMMVAFIVLYIVLLTTLFGTQMSGRNLGVMLVWTVWLFLVVTIFTPLGGRIWCMACPLPAIGEFMQRGALTRVHKGNTNGYRNRFYGLFRKWPDFLANGWLRLFLFLITATLSTTLVAKPRATGIAILLLFIGATLMAGVWELRAFCRYICPINTFISVYGKLGRLSIRKADAEVCAKCRAVFCEKGSTRGWPCPYGLNVRDIDDNYDCGLCTECVRSCLYDNVALRWNRFSEDIGIKEKSQAWTAMVMLVLGIVYTIVYLGHWPVIRDYVNILDKGNWDLFGIYSVILWSVALLLFPGFFWLMTFLSKRLSVIKRSTSELMISLTGYLLPIGLAVWIAFVVQMLFVNISFVGQSLSDPFGWGWNLLGLAATPWKQFLPRITPWLQVFMVLFGFIYSLRNLWRIWNTKVEDTVRAVRGMIPHSFLLLFICLFLIIFYAN